jgi:hypothetical protein
MKEYGRQYKKHKDSAQIPQISLIFKGWDDIAETHEESVLVAQNIILAIWDSTGQCHEIDNPLISGTSRMLQKSFSECYLHRTSSWTAQDSATRLIIRLMFRDETMLQKSFGECYMPENIILALWDSTGQCHEINNPFDV